MIDYVREACERLREQLPAGRQALAEKKQVLTDVKARLARYHERFERAANAGEEDVAWERIKELREQENALKAEIAGLESQQIPSSDRELDAVRARRYLRTLARFFRSRPRYEESLYEALHQHHHFRVAVLARDLVEATLEFDGEIEPSDEDDSMSRDRPMSPGGGQPVYIGRRTGCCARHPLESLRSQARVPDAFMPCVTCLCWQAAPWAPIASARSYRVTRRQDRPRGFCSFSRRLRCRRSLACLCSVDRRRSR